MTSASARIGVFFSIVFLFQLVTLTLASAQVNVVPTFSPATVLPTQTSTLTLRLTNQATQVATDAALTVNLAPGVFIADPANLVSGCGGSVTHGNDPDNGTLALSGGEIPPGDGTDAGFCLIQINVVAPARGSYTTSIPAGALTALVNSQSASNGTPAGVTLVAAASDLQLTLSPISFGGETLQGHETDIRTITLTNNNAIPLTDVSLNWNFNQGSGDRRANNVRIVPDSTITSTCGSPTLDAIPVANENTPVGMLPTSILQMSGGTVPANGTCTISFQIEPARDPGAPTGNPYVEQFHSVPAEVSNSAQGIGNGIRSNEVRLVIATGVQMTKRFNGNADFVTNITSTPGGTAEVWIRFQNSNAQDIQNVSLTDVLPAGMTALPGAVFENGGSSNGLTCTGQFDESDPTRIRLINATVPGAPQGVSGFRRPECVIRAPVTFSECRSYNNNIPAGSLTSSDPAQGYRFSNVPNATLNVSCETLTIQKSFNRDNLENTNLHAGDQVDAVFTLVNQSATAPIINIRIPDDLTTMGYGFYVSPDRIVQNSCGAVSNINGSTVNPYDRDFTLRVQELAPGQSCTITVRLITALDAMTTDINSVTRINTIPANSILFDTSTATDLPYPFELSASRLLVRAIELEKSFSPTTVAPLGVSRLTITIRRRSSERSGTNNIALLDNLPDGHVVAPVPNVFNTCGGTVSADPGASAIQLTGGAIAAPTTLNTSSAICQIQVNVQAPELPVGSTIETATNIIPGDPHGNPLGSGPQVYFSASDTRQPAPYNQLRNLMTASAPLTRRAVEMQVNKSFLTENINGGAPSRVRIEFINTSTTAIALTGVQLTDSFAGTGLRLYSDVNPSFTNTSNQPNASGCTGGSFAGNAGDQQITLSNAAVGVGAICYFEFNVTASQSGNHINTIPINEVISNEGVTNINEASATLGVNTRLGIGKGFNPPVIVAGGQSTLTLEVFNTLPSDRTGDVPAIIDTLPAGVSIIGGTAATTCAGGTATSGIDGGAHFLRLDGGVFPANNVCLVTAQVTADATGTYLNQIPAGALRSVEGDTNEDPAQALLRVIQPPTITKAFNPVRIPVGGTSTVTFTLTNPNGADVLPAGLTNASFSDELVNMAIAAPLFIGGTCTGVQHDLAEGATNVTFSNISLAPNGSCTVQMRVTSDAPGVWPNQSTGVSTEQTPEAGPPSNTVNLTVAAPLTLEKSFEPTSVMTGEVARMTLLMRNPNNTLGLVLGTAANPAIVDIFPTTPGNMVLAPVPDITSSCPAATQIRNLADAAPAPGDAGVRIYGGTIAANASCQISFNVVVDAGGAYLNDIPEIRANLIGGASEVVTGPGDSAVLDAEGSDPAISVLKTGVFNDENGDGIAQPGETITYTYLLRNDGDVILSDVGVSELEDAFSGQFADLGIPVFGGNSGVDPTSPDGVLAPGEIATWTAEYTLNQADVDAGQVDNQALARGTPPGADAAPVTDLSHPSERDEDGPTEVLLPGSADLSLTKTLDTPADPLVAGSVLTYRFTVENTGNVTLSAVDVIDPLEGLSPLVFDEDASTAPAPGEDLAPGDVAVWTAEYTLIQADIDAGGVENTAMASGTPLVGDPVTDDDTVVTPVTADPELALTKTAVIDDPDGDGLVVQGRTVTYTYLVQNLGNVTLTDVEVIEDEDQFSGVFIELGTPVFVVNFGVEPASPAGTLAPGETARWTASYTLFQEDMDRGELVNTALTSGTPPVGDPVTDVDTVVTELPPALAMDMLKTGVFNDENGDGIAQPGETITYTYLVRNSGNASLTDVIVTETEDQFSGIFANLSPPEFVAKVLISTSPDPDRLEPGEVVRWRAEYTLSQADIDAGEVLNIATARGTSDAGDPVTVEDDAITPLAQDPALTLVKTVTAINGDADEERFSAVDDVIAYAITVTNTGNVTLSDVVVSDPLVGLDTVLPTLAVGASETVTGNYTVTQADLDAGAVVNIATASATDPAGDPLAPVEAEVETPGPDAAPGLAILKTVTSVNGDADAVAFAAVGDVIAYAVTVTNTGNVTLSAVQVVDALEGVSTLIFDADASTAPAPGDVLAPGDVAVWTASYTVTQADLDAGAVVNLATASGEGPDGTPTPEVEAEVETPGPEAAPGLAIVKSVTSINGDAQAVAFAAVGDVIAYAITVTNTGNVTLSDVVVSDPLLGLTETVLTLAVGASETVTGNYTVTQADLDAGVVVNIATASGEGPDGTPTPEVEAEVETPGPEAAPGLAIVKSVTSVNGDAQAVQFAALGDVIAYAITVTNTGNVTLSDVVVSDPLLGLTETVLTLAVGASETVTGNYTVTQADLDAGVVVNLATASGEGPDGTPTPEVEAEVETPGPEAVPGLAIVKSVTSVNGDAQAVAFTAVGDVIAYAITVTNTGNVTLSDVVVSDPLVGLDTVLPTLAAGASQVFEVSHTVTQADLDAGGVVNLATASATDPAGDPLAPVEAEVETPGPEAVPGPVPGDLTLEKLVNRSSVVVGDVITYTLKLENTDAGAARLVTLVDTLPAGFSYQPGTARIDGLAVEPVTSGRRLTWEDVAAGPAAILRISYDVYIGGAAGPGVHVNRAQGFDPVTGAPVTPEVQARVRIEADAVFQCATVIGRVFDDLNHDGYFNEEPQENRFAITDQDFIPGKGKFWSEPQPSAPRRERGLPGVRLVTPNGIAVTTDAHGRFSLPCAALPRAIGSNFMLKLDDRTLPLGYRMTTENPRVVRLTPGMLTKMNFGAAIFPVARVDLSARAFDAQGVMRPELRAGVQALVAQIAARPSVVRLSYQAAPDERDSIATARMRAIEQEIRRLWSGTGRYALTIERVVERPARRAGGQ